LIPLLLRLICPHHADRYYRLIERGGRRYVSVRCEVCGRVEVARTTYEQPIQWR
jgi:uncharacterized Zn finger protein